MVFSYRDNNITIIIICAERRGGVEGERRSERRDAGGADSRLRGRRRRRGGVRTWREVGVQRVAECGGPPCEGFPQHQQDLSLRPRAQGLGHDLRRAPPPPRTAGHPR